MGWFSVGAGPVRVGTRGFSVGAGGVRAGASWRGGGRGGSGGYRAESSYDHPALVQKREEYLEWMERVLKGVEAVGLLAQGREYELLKKHARWLDKLHSDCCGLRTHFRDALELDVRQIIFTRELEEAASWFDEQMDAEMGETVRRLSQAAATLDQDRGCPTFCVSGQSVSEVDFE
jgi:hypothetical protein